MAPGTAQGTLPWSWYSDPDVLGLEQERVLREQLLAPFQGLVREALA